jgi:ATP-dependent RNA helicase RhlE
MSHISPIAANFADLGLNPKLLAALTQEGYTTPTPIQAQAIPYLLDGRDLLGLAQTGTGKTAAFLLPILHRLAANRRPAPPRCANVLILAPTRELASQIDQSIAAYGQNLGMTHTVVFGGVSQMHQVAAMRRGVDFLVATPGRLLDLCGQGHIDLGNTAILVLDEADQMLDMGFVKPIRQAVAMLPTERQTLLFSATMPTAIATLAASLLRNPARVEVTPPATTVARIGQTVMFTDAENKLPLIKLLVKSPQVSRAIVFTLTKSTANKVAEALTAAGSPAEAIHGNKSQGQRERALAGFKAGAVRVLVATDLASRGIDVDDVSHVFNFDMPNIPESYVHRIGRTARAGRDGLAVSLCEPEHRAWLAAIERTIGQAVPVVSDHPYHSEAARLSKMKPPVLGGGGRGGNGGHGGRGGNGGNSGRPQQASQPRGQFRHPR